MDNTDRMFNESFNDLSFLESRLNSYYKFVFVFDFDLTLTTKSSNNITIDSNFIELFDDQKKLDKLIKYLNKICECDNIIYINTRALVSDVKYILDKVNIDKFIKKIKGSQTIDEINNPFNYLDLLKYKINEIKDVNILWSIKKVVFLNEISDIENIPKQNILFFDDSIININTSKLNGYINSFLVGSNNSGLQGLDYLLIKLEQILNIIYL